MAVKVNDDNDDKDRYDDNIEDDNNDNEGDKLKEIIKLFSHSVRWAAFRQAKDA